MKRFIKKWRGLMLLLGVAVTVGVLYSADGDIHTWTGKGSRRSNVEFKITSGSSLGVANLVPGATNTNALGTSSLRFSNIYSVLGDFSGAFTATGDVSMSGTVTATGPLVHTPSSVQSVNYGTSTIVPSSRFVVIGSTSSMNMNAVNGPVISTVTAVNGQVLTLISTGTTLGIPTDITLNTAMVYSSTRGAFVSISSVTPRTFIFKTGTGWLQQ